MAAEQTGRRRTYGWLRVMMINLVIIVLGIGSYFLYFKTARESTLSDSYMRSLTRMTERIERFVENGERIGRFLSCDGAASDGHVCSEAWASVREAPGLGDGALLLRDDDRTVPHYAYPRRLDWLPEEPARTEPYIRDGWLFMPSGRADRDPGQDAGPALKGIAVPVRAILSLPAPTFPFDALYLVDSQGRVVTQTHIEDRQPSAHPTELIEVTTARYAYPRLNNLQSALRRSGELELSAIAMLTPEEEREQSYTPDATAASFVTQLDIGGHEFRAFVQPLYGVSVVADREGAEPGGDGMEADDLRPALVGIVEQGRFDRAAMSVGYMSLAMLLGLAVILLASLPFLRLMLSDRHTPVTGWWALRIIVGCTSILLIATILLILWSQNRAEQAELQTHLATTTSALARRLEQRFADLNRALEVYELASNEYGAGDMPDIETQNDRCRDLDEALQAEVNHRDIPLFVPFAFRLNSSGSEKPFAGARISCRQARTSALEVPDRRYFRYWSEPDSPDPARIYVQRLISYIDGSLSMVASRAVHDGVVAVTSDIRDLQLEPLRPHQPAGVRYVLLSTSGEVLFHTNDDLAIVENWLRETESDPDLVGAVLSGQPRTFEAQYRGAPIVGFLTPVGGLQDGLRTVAGTTVGPDLRLVGYVPVADLQALRFYNAVVAMPIILLLAFAWAVLFGVLAVYPGRRQALVFPSAHHLAVYLQVSAGAAASLLMTGVYLVMLWRIAEGSGPGDGMMPSLLGDSVLVLSGALVVQVGWLAAQRNVVFQSHGHRAFFRYLGYSALLATVTVVLVSRTGIDAEQALLLTLVGGGGWLPLFVAGCRLSGRRLNAHLGRHLRVDWGYRGMWTAVLFALAVYGSGTYFVVSETWQHRAVQELGERFADMTRAGLLQTLDDQARRNSMADAPSDSPTGRWRAAVAAVAESPAEASAETMALHGDVSWLGQLVDELPSVNASVSAIRSDLSRGGVGAPYWTVIGPVMLVALVLAALWLVVGAVARRLFGLRTVFANHLLEAPFSARADHPIDWVLYVESLRDPRPALHPGAASVEIRRLRSLDDLDRLEVRSDEVLVLEGFEADIVDPERRQRLIERIGALQDGQRTNGIIIAPVLPSYWMSRHEDVPDAEETLSLTESRRIAQVLQRCTVVTGAPRHPLLSARHDTPLRWDPRPLLDRGVPRSTIHLIRREVRRCPRTARFLEGLSNELMHRMKTHRVPPAQIDRQLVVQVLARAMEGEFLRFWSMSGPDEQSQLLAVAEGGYANFADTETVQSLMQRGLLKKVVGRFDVTSEAFRHFLRTRSRTRLEAIQSARHQGSAWGAVLPSLIVVVGLILAFLIVSGARAAELMAAGIAAMLAALPALNALVALISRQSSKP